MTRIVRFAALGMDHRHIYGMTQGMLDAGAALAGWWSEGDPQPVEGYIKRFPDAPCLELQNILDDPTIDLVLIACRPDQRANLTIAAMRAGKDVMTDKPGCISATELLRLRETVAETGRIWSVNFSERFETRASTVASRLVAEGAIGRMIQTLGLGPHRLNAPTRPDWFFDASTSGGILTGIASHEIEQFPHYTGSEEAEITLATVGNYANAAHPEFEEFGDIALRSGQSHGYVRVDWYTADALPNRGDGRLLITGTEGTIELRKYVDVAGRAGTDHLYLVNGTRCEHIDCAGADLPYFRDLIANVLNRTQTACPQSRTFLVCELAMAAQAIALGRA